MQKLALLFVPALVVGLSLSAGCSDDKPKPAVGDGGADASGFDAATLPPPSDAATDAGPLAVEGDTCQTAKDCDKGLSCVVGSNGNVTVGICARSCATDGDCGSERCYSQTGQTADAHCVNVVRTEFATCGIGDTSICGQPMTCLYSPTSSVGLCVNICDLPGTAASGDDAGTDDAGAPVSKDAGTPAPACATGEMCLTDIVDSKTQGVCGMLMDRGKSCGSSKGMFCHNEDLCSPDDPNASTSPLHCHEDCTSTSRCSKGKCTDVGGVAYCL